MGDTSRQLRGSAQNGNEEEETRQCLSSKLLTRPQTAAAPHATPRPSVDMAKDQQMLVPVLASHYKSALELIGEDPSRQGLLKTPERAAKALLYFTKGYHENMQGMI